MTYITEAMVYNSLRYQMNRSQTTMFEKVEQASSGKRIASAEDDPNGAAIVAEYDDHLSQLVGMKKTSIDVEARINATENALKEIHRLLSSINTKAVEGGNGLWSPDQMKDIGMHVEAMQAQVLQQANATSNGRYLFGGYIDNAAPFVMDGTYTGDDNVASVDVAPNLSVNANVPGSAVINSPTGINILGALGDLVTALKNNTQPQVAQDGLSNVNKALRQVESSLAGLAKPQETIKYAEQLRSSLNITLQEQRAAYNDVDALQSFSELIQAQSTMQAAIMVSQQVIQSINRSLSV